MADLRQVAAELIAHPLVPVPPIEGVVARARHYRAARRRRQVGAGAVLAVMVVTAIARAGVGGIGNDSLRTVGNPSRDEEPSVTSTSVVPGFGGDGSTTFPTLPWSGENFDGDWSRLRREHECKVMRPATPALKVLVNGIRNDALDDFYEEINVKGGGLCGRLIELQYGNADQANLTKYVAVLGTPLDEQLDKAIARGRIAQARIPVVSGDGLPEVQHRSRWVYPVGPSAGAMTRTAAAHARAKGAKSFAIVYDADRSFGREAADSFDRYVRRNGGELKAAIPLNPSATVYGPEADRLTSACGIDGCDFVFLALLAETAQTWLQTNPTKPRVQLAGLSTVLADGYSDHCVADLNASCDGLVAWSGYVPWSRAVPGTQAQWWNAEAQHAYGLHHGSALREGTVIGARVLYHALRAAGPDATRETVRRALDSLTFTSHITVPLSWPLDGYRAGNPVSQAWVLRSRGFVTTEQQRMYESGGNLNAGPTWEPVGTGWVRDPG